MHPQQTPPSIVSIAVPPWVVKPNRLQPSRNLCQHHPVAVGYLCQHDSESCPGVSVSITPQLSEISDSMISQKTGNPSQTHPPECVHPGAFTVWPGFFITKFVRATPCRCTCCSRSTR